MNAWINLNALWKIVVIGLLAGAGLPALFAVGLRALAPRAGSAGTAAAESAPGSGRTSASGSASASASGSAEAGTSAAVGTETPPDLLGKLIAGLCFAAVVAAMVWGVFSIVQHR